MTNFSRSITAAVGALIISSTFVAAAIAPAANIQPSVQAQA